MDLPNNVKYMSGNDNILRSSAQWLVCPTNAVGAMGAGLAKYFSLSIPKLRDEYKAHCRQHEPIKLEPFVFHHQDLKRVYCLHTKIDWRYASTLKIIDKGLHKLEDWILRNQVRSIAIPALGCGKGQLAWEDVLPQLLKLASKFPNVIFEIYPPKS